MVQADIKNKLLNKIEQIDDPKIINEIYRLLAIDVDEDVYQTNDAQKKAIETGLSEIESGETLTEKEANEQTSKWLNKKSKSGLKEHRKREMKF